MTPETVYYCWSCDAHRRVKPAADGTGCCPRCRQNLSADCRVSDGGLRDERLPAAMHAMHARSIITARLTAA